jgi:hypothetical protein
MWMYLGYKIARRSLSTVTKRFSFLFCELVVAVGVVECASGGFSEILCKIWFFSWAYGRFFVRELAFEGIVCDGTLGVLFFEPFGLREAKGYLSWRVVGAVFLYFLMRDKRHFIHSLNFIMNLDKININIKTLTPKYSDSIFFYIFILCPR